MWILAKLLRLICDIINNMRGVIYAHLFSERNMSSIVNYSVCDDKTDIDCNLHRDPYRFNRRH